MSGILTDAMTAKLRSGVYQIEHTYFLKVPEDAAKTGYQTKTIHDVTSVNVVNVTDHGVMVRTGYNYSISDPGKFAFGEYKFVASNVDGFFSKGADLWEHDTTNYVAEPHECQVSRYSSIFTTSWALITGSYYSGQVDRVEYQNAKMDTPKSVTFFCRPIDLEKLTSNTWNEDDYDELDLSTLTFTGPLPEDN